MEKKSQASLEFLMIFGISLSILLILTGLFFGYFNQEKTSLDVKHIDNIGQEIISNVEKIYFLGNGNRLTLNTKFPEGITNFTIIHKNNFTLTDGNKTSFDYLSITYFNDNQKTTNTYETNQFYIRFNCTRCYHDTTNNISYYNESDFNAGNKKIRFESKGDWVSVDFII